MHGVLPGDTRRSNCAGDTSVTGTYSDDISVADDADWFAEVAQGLLLPKPGTALHYITGFDERSCQRYAAGTVKPPGYLVRAFLRSEQGGQFLTALMHGAAPRWWLEAQRAERVLRQADNLDLR